MLSKLHLTVSSPDPGLLRTVLELVAEAIESKVASDATSRNALAKMQTTLLKLMHDIATAERDFRLNGQACDWRSSSVLVSNVHMMGEYIIITTNDDPFRNRHSVHHGPHDVLRNRFKALGSTSQTHFCLTLDPS